MNTNADQRRGLWLACLLPLAVSLLFAQRQLDSPNVSSRMDTIQSLVEQRSFCIDKSLNKFMVDIVKIDGRFYSEKPPLLAVVGAGIYLPLYALGVTFERQAEWIYYILTVALVGVPLAVGLWLLARCLALAGLTAKAVTTTTLLTGAGTMFLPYAVTFNNHVPAATAIAAALYCMLRAEAQGARAARWLAAAGFFGTLAFNLDLAPGGAVLLAFGVLVLRREKKWRDLPAYVAGAVGPLALYFFLNYLATGDPRTIYLHPEWYEYEGSILRSYDALKRPFGRTVAGQYFHMLIGYRGFFLYSPILLFGLWEAARQAVRGGRFRLHAIVALLVPVVVVGAYAMQTGGMAGGSYGMRWLLPVIPLLAFFMGQGVERVGSRLARLLFGVAAALSVVIAALGVPRPWSTNIRSPFTFLDNLAYFAQVLAPPAKPPVYWVVNLTSLEKDYAYFEIGRWHMNHGFTRAAIADLEHAGTLVDPQRARQLEPGGSLPDYFNLIDYYLGQLYDQSGAPDRAVEVYRRLLERDPRNTGAWNNYAVSLRKLGLPQQALQAYRRSLEIDPDKPFTRRSIGQLLWDIGRRDEALQHWERALQIEPRQADLRRRLVNIYYEGGEKTKALEHLRLLKRQLPDDPEIRRALQQLQSDDRRTTVSQRPL